MIRMKTRVWRYSSASGSRAKRCTIQQTVPASVVTKTTAAPMPKALSMELVTPTSGQFPRKRIRTMLLTNIAAMISRR